ncbi:MAG: oligosaccharide flippase family protein [Verrucomicrobia bacterium]|nr:oligosaccharide flippase family protein [Verrucomicrobiota bacterium]
MKNVLFSWGGQFVFILAGFIMPRMIDARLGQDLLGVWDFAWSLVASFQWIEAGISGSVNRYVGRYWAARDQSGINRVVSSATAVLVFAALLVLILTVTLSVELPRFFGSRLGEHTLSAQWAVLFLGSSMSVQMAVGAFNGVVTGCHRWELLNIIRSSWYLVAAMSMVAALFQGGGLLALAALTFVGEVGGQMTRVVVAHRICPGLRLRRSLVSWSTIREMYVFGGKVLLQSVSNLLLQSTTSVLILAFLGPAALALYSRPRALVHQMNSLIRRMTMTLIPTTSSMEGSGDLEAVQELLLKSVRYTLYLTLPIVLTLSFFGGPILRLWMGSEYANGVLVMVVAVGALGPIAQTPVLDILVGLNCHGRASVGQLIASLCAIGALYVALGQLGLGITGAALVVALPRTLLSTIYYPLLICSRLGLSVGDYARSVAVGPSLHLLPFAACLGGARLIFREAPLEGLFWSGALGGGMLAIVYWRYVLPARIKTWVRGALGVAMRPKAAV